jgi:putative proteasome-type protease
MPASTASPPSAALVSFDSTIKANISVAPPIDVVTIRPDGFRVTSQVRVREDDTYFVDLRRHWGEGLRRVFTEAPDPPWYLAAG